MTSSTDIAARYQRAKIMIQGAKYGSKTVAFNTTVYPHWIGDTDCFWYTRETRTGFEFCVVDAKEQTKHQAFDHNKLSVALANASGETVVADNLPISFLDLSDAPEQVLFTAFDKRWVYHNRSEMCEVLFNIEDTKISPDGQYALFCRDYNLWVRELSSGKERALTEDGERFYEYATTPRVLGADFGVTLEALWSPDSQRIFTLVIDTREVCEASLLVDHLPADGSLRPQIINAGRRVAFPGDEHVDVYRFLSIELDSGKTHFANTVDSTITFMPYIGYFTGHRAWCDQDSRHAYFVEEERGMKAHRLQRMDMYTGNIETLIEEKSDHLAMLIPSSHVTPLYMPLPDTNEVIWYSERSGTAHFYLYDTTTGELKNTITQGDWVVRNGLRVDVKRRELTVQTAGRIEGRNPYYCDICRVNIDTGELITVISTDHEYIVCDQRSRVTHQGADKRTCLGVSPSSDYMVTTRSRVDQTPVTLLLDRNGKELMVVETADVSGLPENCTWPEPVMLKAEDGETDIYAVVYRPSNFDPDKSYPVLDCTTGYCSPTGSFTNSHASIYLIPWALAELGFIAVVVFNRGTERLRNKAFNEFIDPIMPADPEQLIAVYNNDCVAGIKQLAERYPAMDLSRVGIPELGHTPRAIIGLFLHPEFYHVGVSVNPCFDTRLKASMGMDHRNKDTTQLVDFVDNFDGKLLVIAHMLSPYIQVTMTFHLVEALRKANKRFDMLMLPGAGHNLVADEYSTLRSWDYLVEHLLDEKPPKEFKLSGETH